VPNFRCSTTIVGHRRQGHRRRRIESFGPVFRRVRATLDERVEGPGINEFQQFYFIGQKL
jgi:hypothetical protein